MVTKITCKEKNNPEKPKKLPSFLSLVERISTVHGTVHLATNNGKISKVWIAFMILNILLTIGFIMVIKQKFNNDQIVTVVNANCKVNQVPFPAVSICNFNMVSYRESRNIANVLSRYNRTDVEVIAFFNALHHLKYFGKDSKGVGNFSEIMAILKHHYFTVDTIMEEIHQKCENLLLYCLFNRKRKNCNDMFSLVKTVEGHCCIFNYAALNDASEIPLLPSDDTLEYYIDQGETTSSNIIVTSESGRMSGVEVVFDVEPDDYPVWSKIPYFGVKVLLSDPNDFPETRIVYRYVTPGQAVDLKVQPLVFTSEEEIRRLEPQKRSCWFHDEIHLQHTDRYSYETCCTECKMKNYLATCGCVPYKYPREHSIRICEFEDLACLNNSTVYSSLSDMSCNPTCYMECQDKTYLLTSDLTPFQPHNYPSEIINGHNSSNLAAVRVFFGKSRCNCYKLALLIDFNYFIATYGGIFSLSFGGSIITLLELAYLFMSILMDYIRTLHA